MLIRRAVARRARIVRSPLARSHSQTPHQASSVPRYISSFTLNESIADLLKAATPGERLSYYSDRAQDRVTSWIGAISIVAAVAVGFAAYRLGDRQNGILKTQNDILEKQTDILGETKELQKRVQINIEDQAQREFEKKAARLLDVGTHALALARDAHEHGVRSDYLTCIAPTKRAAELLDKASRLSRFTTRNGGGCVAGVVLPQEFKDFNLEMERAQLHYFHASTCLHSLDEDYAPMIKHTQALNPRLAFAQKQVLDARKSLEDARNIVTRLAVPSDKESDVERLVARIELRKADAESFYHSLIDDPPRAAEPYELAKPVKPEYSTLNARFKSNQAMAYFGLGQYSKALAASDEALAGLPKGTATTSVNPPKHSGLRGAAKQAGSQLTKSGGQSIATRLAQTFDEETDACAMAYTALLEARKNDMERLRRRKLVAVKASRLFFGAMTPVADRKTYDGSNLHLRELLLTVVDEVESWPAATDGTSPSEDDDAPDDGSQPQNSVADAFSWWKDDKGWIRRRGIVRILAAMHVALDRVATTKPGEADELADLAISIASQIAQVKTASGFFSSRSGDFGAFACRTASYRAHWSWASHKNYDARRVPFSPLARSRRLKRIAQEFKDARPGHESGSSGQPMLTGDDLGKVRKAIEKMQKLTVEA